MGSYDIKLVCLSYLIAVVAAFITLSHAQHLRDPKGQSKYLWITMGGLTLGAGIWSMHFIGMLAYDFSLTMVSILLAMGTGLIIPVGYWVIDTACKQIRTWIDIGITDLRIGINLSAKQFADPKLATSLDNTVKKYQVPSQCIDLEITESVALDDLDQTINILQRFKQSGYTISMDDFGTGYSSLSSIHLLPIDILKIDRAFIKDIGSNGEHGAMAKTIINMSHNLGLSVIAEGAETDDHIEFLQANHCNEVQGFYYSRPLPADEFVKYYQQYINSEKATVTDNRIASRQ